MKVFGNMATQSIIVLAVVWLAVAIPAIYFIVKGSSGDCGERRTRISTIKNTSLIGRY